MFLVDFRYSSQQKDSTASKFNSGSQIIDFVAKKSYEHPDFGIVHINKYENGQLIPYDIQYANGRLDLVENRRKP